VWEREKESLSGGSKARESFQAAAVVVCVSVCVRKRESLLVAAVVVCMKVHV